MYMYMNTYVRIYEEKLILQCFRKSDSEKYNCLGDNYLL